MEGVPEHMPPVKGQHGQAVEQSHIEIHPSYPEQGIGKPEYAHTQW